MVSPDTPPIPPAAVEAAAKGIHDLTGVGWLTTGPKSWSLEELATAALAAARSADPERATGGRIGGTCGVCGRPGHRYGTTDREHAFDAVACVNMLLPEIDALTLDVERLDAGLVRALEDYERAAAERDVLREALERIMVEREGRTDKATLMAVAALSHPQSDPQP